MSDPRFEKAIESVRETFRLKGGEALKQAQQAFSGGRLRCPRLSEAVNWLLAGWNDLTRPALIALSCEAVGGKAEAVKSIARAMILLGAGIDIHDDIIDDSHTKGGKKTALGAFGRDTSLLTGDLLLTTGLLEFAAALTETISPRRAKELLRTVNRLLLELVEGESLETRLRGRLDVTPEEYLRVVWLKAADAEAYTRIGGTLGGGSRTEVDALGAYGRRLGMLVILRDDLADMLEYRGELPHRIRKEALPLPLLYSFQVKRAKNKLLRILKNKPMKYSDCQTLFNLCHEFGALSMYKNVLEQIATAAKRQLRIIKSQAQKNILEGIIDSIIPPI